MNDALVEGCLGIIDEPQPAREAGTCQLFASASQAILGISRDLLRITAGVSLALMSGMRRNRYRNPLLLWVTRSTIFRSSSLPIPRRRDHKSEPPTTALEPPRDLDLVLWLVNPPDQVDKSARPMHWDGPDSPAAPRASTSAGNLKLSLKTRHTI